MTFLPKQGRARLLVLSAFALISALPLAAGAEPFMEQGVSRWGADYQRFPVKSGGAAACSAACLDDSECRAWAYVKPGVMGPAGECRLKSAVPHGKADPCCVSGIAAGASAGVLAGYPSDNRETSMTVAASPERAASSGVTGAAKPAKRGAKSTEDELRMSIEAEAPEALRAIAAPVDLIPPKWTPAED